MIKTFFKLLFAGLGLWALNLAAATLYVDLNSANATPPFTNWLTAATNIQDAIDAASAGDTVLVTNGIYRHLGKVMAGDLINRIAINKAITVQSVNGAVATIIQGQWDAGNVYGNGVGAVRCAWLTNGAMLGGFTLMGGATRMTGDINTLQSGGGVWCASTNAVVANCVLQNNSCYYNGGGSYYGTLNNCLLKGNNAAYPGSAAGGGSYYGTLNNCTLTRNQAGNVGGGSYGGTLNNCIVWNNSGGIGGANLGGSGTVRYTCTTPLSSGTGNIATDPQFLGDGIHIAATSPCRSAGATNYATGTDIDSQAWTNPPAMGCDEWLPSPVIPQPLRWQPVAGAIPNNVCTVVVIGQEPFECFWSKDGVPIEDGAHYGGAHTTNLLVRGFGLEDAGSYRVVVSNAFGMATNQVARLVIHCVNAAAASPVSPYTNWATAAPTIQEAIDSAAAGDLVWVTNGLYATGGKAMAGGLTNRVALDKALTVWSVNGPLNTIIQGARDPVSTNGPLAVRCAWLANSAMLSGFTLTGGATRTTAANSDSAGGGVWSSSTFDGYYDCIIMNCIIVSNAAYSGGGGSFGGALRNCAIIGNSVLRNTGGGGGAFAGKLNNCTIVGNYAPSVGGGNEDGTLNNCIIYFNSTKGSSTYANNAGGVGINNCSPGLISPNVSTDPQFVDAFHIAATSPCRAAGTNLFCGSDIDGQAWGNPPSIGCDEFSDSERVGPLSVIIQTPLTNTFVGRWQPLTGQIIGRASRLEWSFGDGPLVTNVSYLTYHVWTNAGDYPVTFTAYNTDNPGGVTTNVMIHVSVLNPPLLEAPVWTTNGYSCQFVGQADAFYILQVAANLVSPIKWTTVQMLTSSGGTVQMTNASSTNTSLFYRVTAQ